MRTETINFSYESERTGMIHTVVVEMRVEREMYGADADGRRGEMQETAEIESIEVDGMEWKSVPRELQEESFDEVCKHREGAPHDHLSI